MNNAGSSVHGRTSATDASFRSLDRSLGLAGLVVAVAAISIGLAAGGTGNEWLIWIAAGLATAGLAGVVRNSIRVLLAYEWRVGFGWFVAAWFEVLIGLQLTVFALGDPSGPVQRADPLRRLSGAEMIALPSVVIGIALGLTSIGILRGHLRKSVRPHRVVSGTLAIVGTAMTVSGMLAWLAPPSTADLKLEAQVWLVEESDIFQVLRRNGGLDDVGDIRPYGDQGTSDAAAGGIDQWVVVSVVEGDEGAEGYQEQIETLYGPTTAEAAWAYANRTLLYQGTQQELDAWAAEQGSTYKDRLTPSLLIWMGVLLIAAAFTLAPLRSTQELSDEDPR